MVISVSSAADRGGAVKGGKGRPGVTVGLISWVFGRRAGAGCLSLVMVLSALLQIVAPGRALAESAAFRQAVAEAAAGDDALAEFYRTRDYAPLWTAEDATDRRAAFFTALDRVSDHGLPDARYDAAGLRTRFAALETERDRGELEVAMSRAFVAYAGDVRNGVLEPREVDKGIAREVPRRDPLALIRGLAVSDPANYIRALPPADPRYDDLMRSRQDLLAAIGGGGWGATIPGAALTVGDEGPGVVALRDRLIAMGYLRPTSAGSYNGAIQKAVQAFQIEHGITPDGIAGESTIAELNVGPEARLRSVTVALERMRWMNGLTLGDRHIWVNLPDFTAKIVDRGRVTFETVTVVGMNEPDRRSPAFSDEMEFMVINPTWNVPRSITVKEYLPMLQRNPNAARHLRLVDSRGRVVDRGRVNFAAYTAKNFPFSMSQPPSDDNALGLVKFMFPNPYNIYLHDTPSKSLFVKEVRAFSHGCIRLGRPFEFAHALLARQVPDPVAEFERHLATKGEHALRLKESVPVHLVYFTALPNAKGRIEYRRDVYGRDARIFEALEAAGVALPEVQG